jgi:DNA-binding SARP family transcriptional activator
MPLAGAESTVSPLAICLFGPFEVRRNGALLPRPRTRKAQWLLALLALRPGVEVERAWFAGMLWPDRLEAQAFTSLRNSLADLRQVLGPEAARLRSPSPRTLFLDLAGAQVDVLAFDAAIGRGDLPSLEEAVALYRGSLLEECVETWVFQERQAREQAYLQALERLAAHAMAVGEPTAVERHLRRAVAVDPLRETAQRALMQALAAGGNYAAAVLAYRELRLLLHRELNAEPDPETTALFQQIRDEARRRGAAAAPSPSAEPQPQPVSSGQRVALLYKRDAQPDEHLLQFLETKLRARGFHIFIDRHLSIGVEWAKAIERQIRTSDAVIPLLSVASVPSEMLQYEIEIAHESAQQFGKPRLLPVRIRDTGPLPEGLAAILGPLEYALWEGPQDDERLVTELLRALDSPAVPDPAHRRPSREPAGVTASPDPTETLEPVGGAVPLDSPFYVARPTDAEFRAAIARRDSIVLVKGARQMGKTSLLARGLHQARAMGADVLLTDFQLLSAAHLASADALLLGLAEWMTVQLDLDASPEESWNPRCGPSVNFQQYFRRQVLDRIAAPIVWGLDEVDRLFTCDFGGEIFGMFRSWHNARSLDPTGPWSRLTLAIAYATEAHLFITNVNQSPFNVGTRLTLEDFTLEQVADLNQRYGTPLRGPLEVERYYALVSGHPYLVRRGLHEMVTHGITLADFADPADGAEGIFGDHLRRILVLLVKDPAHCDAVRDVLGGRPCPTPESFYRLRGAGVLAGDSARTARPRCRLYATYLERHLL